MDKSGGLCLPRPMFIINLTSFAEARKSCLFRGLWKTRKMASPQSCGLDP